MKKNGFTLVEILAVLVLISALAIIGIPSILNYINNSKDKISAATEKIIFAGVDLYLDRAGSFKSTAGYYDYCVTLEEVVESGLLEAPIIDSASGEEIDLNKFVKVTFNYNDDLKIYKSNYEIADSCTSKKYSCIMDDSSDRNIDVGDVITCGTEEFYVIPDHKLAGEGTVSLLAKYNLNINTTIQSKDNPSSVTFSSPLYDDSGNLIAYWADTCNESKPCWVYNEKSNLYQYIENYNNNLKEMGVNNSTATLMYYDLIKEISNGINIDNNNYYGILATAVDWLYNVPSYWIGDSSYPTYNAAIHIHPQDRSNIGSICGGTLNNTQYGIRPVIIIPEEDINNN